MRSREILMDAKGHAISPREINKKINDFGDSYNNTVEEIIKNSEVLDNEGIIFTKCAHRILSNFGMTRNGPFQKNPNERLWNCWVAVGADLIEIKESVRKSGLSRNRYLLEFKFSRA